MCQENPAWTNSKLCDPATSAWLLTIELIRAVLSIDQSIACAVQDPQCDPMLGYQLRQTAYRQNSFAQIFDKLLEF